MVASVVVLDILHARFNVILVVLVHHAARRLPLCIAKYVALLEQSIARVAAVERVQVAVIGDKQEYEDDSEQFGRVHVEVLDEIAAPFVVAVGAGQKANMVAGGVLVVGRLHLGN